MKNNEKKLLFELKKGDKEVFMQCYDDYVDQIYRFIFYKVGNVEEAEDLTSAVFLKIWNFIRGNQVDEYKSLKSLIYRIARNTVIDQYRKRSVRDEFSTNQADEIEIIDIKQDSAAMMDAIIDKEMISSKLMELKDEYRELIVLRYIDELSIAEIARILEKSAGSVRVDLHRALKTLKNILGVK